MMPVTEKTIVVVGLGKSGAATAKFLKRRGASVTLSDSAGEQELDQALIAAARADDIALELGGHTEKTFLAADMIVISPGVPLSLSVLQKALQQKIPVIGEIELAATFVTQPLVAVTGTNGKTTVTTLIGEMLQACGRAVFVGGNIGDPLIGFVDRNGAAEVVVVEVSSFQLETIVAFRPAVAVILNISEDHLARYDDFSGYVRTKGRILENQQKADVAVLNAADDSVRQLSKKAAGRRLFFNRSHGIREGAIIGGSRIDLVTGGKKTESFAVPEGVLRYPHNLENVAAAALAVMSVGGHAEGIRATLKKFRGLPHRLELVARVGGIDYVDDSKATNPDAVRRALESFERPVVLLLGGEDKGCDFGVLKDIVRQRVKAAVLLGASRQRLKNVLNGSVPLMEAGSMWAAVQRAAELAEPGEVVLLSPACSSFDMYESYAHRGRDFCQAVQKIREGRL